MRFTVYRNACWAYPKLSLGTFDCPEAARDVTRKTPGNVFTIKAIP